MRIKNATGSVVGENSHTHWSQVLSTPSACAVIEVVSETTDATSTGIRLLSQLSAKLNTSPKDLNEVERIVHDFKNLGASSVAIIVPYGDFMYIASSGEAKVYIKRQENFSILLGSDGAVSGQVKKDDTLLLATHEFIQNITVQELPDTINHSPAEEIAEKITLSLHQQKQTFNGSALIYQVKDIVEYDGVVNQNGNTQVKKKLELPWITRRTIARAYYAWKTGGVKGVARGIKHRTENKLKEYPNTPIKFIAVITIFVFAVSIVLGIQKQQGNAKNKEINQAVENARHMFEEGVALIELNPIKGRERIKAARDILLPFKNSKSLTISDKKTYEGLLKNVEQTLSAAMQSYQITPELFYDVSLLKQNTKIDTIALYGDIIGLADNKTQTVFQLKTVTKSAQVFGGGDYLKSIKSLDITADAMVVLASGGIYKINSTDQVRKPIIASDPEWGEIRKIVTFGGNIYLLDVTKNRIWKYVSTDNGFSERREYLNADTLVDLSNSNNMTIDGQVWVGTGGGKILKFSSGRLDPFEPKGLETPFGTSLVVYTNEDLENVYVLDIQNKRIVVLNKDGSYVAQYYWNTANFVPVDFVIVKAQKKAILLSGGKLYSFDLK